MFSEVNLFVYRYPAMHCYTTHRSLWGLQGWCLVIFTTYKSPLPRLSVCLLEKSWTNFHTVFNNRESDTWGRFKCLFNQFRFCINWGCCDDISYQNTRAKPGGFASDASDEQFSILEYPTFNVTESYFWFCLSYFYRSFFTLLCYNLYLKKHYISLFNVSLKPTLCFIWDHLYKYF